MIHIDKQGIRHEFIMDELAPIEFLNSLCWWSMSGEWVAPPRDSTAMITRSPQGPSRHNVQGTT